MSSNVTQYDYDLIVIGGGSGGMAAAKEASKCGVRVALFDFVKPSYQGTVWGLGGTCVNVGCVPKKLMHYSGLIGAMLHHDAEKFGWSLQGKRKEIEGQANVESEGDFIPVRHDWGQLVQTVQRHIRSLNFGYKSSLRSAGVKYINASAKFVGPHEISYTINDESITTSGKYILIAAGGRPSIPLDVPGAVEVALSSDDLFSWKSPPGKTLVVGGSYIALECAGFLTELGVDVTVCVRSILLRGFDQQCAEKVGGLMKEMGTKFIRPVVPTAMKKLPSGKIEVTFNDAPTDVFDTVLYATGRHACTASLDMEKAGLTPEKNGKLKGMDEQTNVQHIFAVGDCLYSRPELTPVAIQAGERLVRRLFAGKTQTMNYENIPTTVFTPVEYGFCGLSEEDAVSRYGAADIETYLFEFTKLELSAAHREKAQQCREGDFDVDFQPTCLSKLVCLKSQDEKVLGFHHVGPHAGEMSQGMALAISLGAKKSNFDDLVGIHPTDAESFTSLSITRASGESWVASGGCGGGKCG